MPWKKWSGGGAGGLVKLVRSELPQTQGGKNPSLEDTDASGRSKHMKEGSPTCKNSLRRT